MAEPKDQRIISRRTFLRGMRWTPLLFIPSPVGASSFHPIFEDDRPQPSSALLTDLRFIPHYPAKSPLDDLLRLVPPGADEYVTEKYAVEIGGLLAEWSTALKISPPALATLAKFVHPAIQASSLSSREQTPLRSDYGIEVMRRRFADKISSGREQFLEQMKNYFADIARIEAAEFEI